MKQNSDTKRRPRRLLATAFALAAVGLAVLVVAISTTGGGSNPARDRAASGQPTPVAHVAQANRHTARTIKVTKAPAAPATKSSAPKAAAESSSAIPQNNGGDSDPDNNGGPSDGDGNI